MEDLDLPSDVFDSDELDSPLDPINVTAETVLQRNSSASSPKQNSTLIQPPKATSPSERASQPAASQTAPAAERRHTTSSRSKSAPTVAAQPMGGSSQIETSVAASAQRETQPSLDWSVDFSFFRDGRFSRLVGVILILTAVYLLLVSISFFSTGAADQSAIGIEGASVENVGGLVGAIASHAIISEWLGLGAFVIIFMLAALGLAFVRLKAYNIIGLTIKSLISTIALSVIAGYVSMHFVSHFPLGGAHGYYINHAVMNLGGEIGALLLSILLVAMIVIIFIKEVTSMVIASVKAYHSLREKVARENMHRRAVEMAVTATAHDNLSPSPQPDDSGASVTVAAPVTDNTGNEAVTTAAPQHHQAVSVPTDKELHHPIVIDPDKLQLLNQSAATQPVNPAVSVNITRTPELDEIEIDDIIELPGERSSATINASNDRQPGISQAPTYMPEQPHQAQRAQNMEIAPESNAIATPASTGRAEVEAPSAQPQPTEAPGLTALDELESAENLTASDPDSITPAPATPAYENKQAEAKPADTIRTAPDIVTASNISSNAYDPTAELSHFHFPSLETLNEWPAKAHNIDLEEQEANKMRIRATLASFGIEISHIEATIGPTVTLYEVVPGEGVRISKIKNLEDDIARSIAAIGTRIIAPIPGKETVGIEVPNKDPQVVPIRTILSSEAYQNCKMALPMAMGATISNEVYIADLTKMPHLLVAGATGTGKSVGLNTIIASLLFKKHPAELKFVMVDPKMVEFSLYKKLERHYLAKLPDEEEPIITDPHKVVPTLNSLCVEMDNRYKLLQGAYVRSISEYNKKFTQRLLNPADGHRFLPYIVVVVDEFADLIMMAGKEVEQPIARIAQKARAVGIHLILATQRPSTNVITGIIKANFPGRIAFRVFQMVDSRTILDRPGANQLIGRGDMLFSRDGVIDRVQCALIETDEVERLCDAIASQQGYFGAYELPEYVPEGSEGSGRGGSLNDADPLFGDAGRYVISANQASTTSLQRRYEIGYPRAGKIMDQLEKAGVVGPAQGSKPRNVLIDSLAFERLLENMGIN